MSGVLPQHDLQAARILDLEEQVEALKLEVNERGQWYFNGNSVQHWYDKAHAYKGIVFAVCEAFRSLGYDGEFCDLQTLPARLQAFADSLKAEKPQP